AWLRLAILASYNTLPTYIYILSLHDALPISVLVIRLRSLRLLRVSGIVMRLRMFLLLITFLKASHSFRKVISRRNIRRRITIPQIGRAVQQECRDRARIASSPLQKKRVHTLD